MRGSKCRWSLSFCEQRNAALMGTALEGGESKKSHGFLFMGFGGEGDFSAGASARAVTGVGALVRQRENE